MECVKGAQIHFTGTHLKIDASNVQKELISWLMKEDAVNALLIFHFGMENTV